MKSHLKLVHANIRPEARLVRGRPIRTDYAAITAPRHVYEGVGHSTTIFGAIKAAFTRLLRGDYTVARVHNEFGDQVCMLRLNGDRIIVRGRIPINL